MNRPRLTDALALSILLAVALLLRWQARDVWTYDLQPWPDALEYAHVGWRLKSCGEWTLHIQQSTLPSRYPPGMSLLIAPWLLLPGFELWHSYLPVLLCSLATVVITFSWLRGRVGLLAALIGVSILVFSPTHVHFSVLTMSEIPSCLLLLVAGTQGLRLLEMPAAEGRRLAFGAGLLCGLSALLRYPNALIGALVPGLLALDRKGRGKVLPFVAGLAIGLCVLLAYNQVVSGAFWRSGYRFWEPDDYANLNDHLSGRFFLEPDDSEWSGGNLRYYTGVLLGIDRSLLNPFVVVVAMAGAISMLRHRRKPELKIALGMIAVTFLFYCAYFFRAARLLVVLLPFVAMLCARGAEWLFSHLPRAPQRISLAAAILVVNAGLAYGIDGLRRGKGETLEELYAHRFGGPEDAVLPHLDQALSDLPSGSVLIVDLPRLLVEPALKSSIDVVNLSEFSSDKHTDWAWKHSLRDLQGRPFRPPVVLRRDGSMDVPTVEGLKRHLEHGGRVFLLYSRRLTVFSKESVKRSFGAVFRIESLLMQDALSLLEVHLRS